MSKNRSGDDGSDEEDAEFRLRRSTAASLQNSTHLGVLTSVTIPVSKLLREKFDDKPAHFSPTDLCFCRSIGYVSEFRKRDSRSKKSDRSN
uniref:Uncharacterized protein n=1 Tax=Rhizophora mucronata TaxID=61149 RepID=A0A2P2QPJ3_RHIMU